MSVQIYLKGLARMEFSKIQEENLQHMSSQTLNGK